MTPIQKALLRYLRGPLEDELQLSKVEAQTQIELLYEYQLNPSAAPLSDDPDDLDCLVLEDYQEVSIPRTEVIDY